MALDKNVSPDADTTLFFTRGSVGAVDGSIELPAGKIVEFLVGFANKVNIILNKIQSGTPKLSYLTPILCLYLYILLIKTHINDVQPL